MGKGGRKERCDEPHPIPFHSIHSRLRIASHPSLSTCLAHRPRGTRTHTWGSNKQSPHAVKSPKRRIAPAAHPAPSPPRLVFSSHLSTPRQQSLRQNTPHSHTNTQQCPTPTTVCPPHSSSQLRVPQPQLHVRPRPQSSPQHQLRPEPPCRRAVSAFASSAPMRE